MKSFYLIVFVLLHTSINSINIAVAGSGYVGLVLGAGLAEFGHNVCCLDINKNKIDMLNQGKVPIYEPGLSELITRHLVEGNIIFSTDISSGIQNSDVVFIAVGTPMGPDGHADLTAVEAVARSFAQNLNSFKTLVIKSTVPIGTNKKLKQFVEDNKQTDVEFSIVSNPEFLKEGLAINDFINPDRAVFGIYQESDKELMCKVFAPLVKKNIPLFFTDPASAEMIKYASNSFLATKVSFINEVSQLCSKTGANIGDVAVGMGLDNRIGSSFLKPGPGFGGSCFPKDTNEMIKLASEYEVDLSIVKSALAVNGKQHDYVLSRAADMLGEIKDKTIAVLGLAFKAFTDDVRYSPAIEIINKLLSEGAHVKAYDPIAMENMKNEIGNIYYAQSEEDAINEADFVLVLTEWPQFKNLDWSAISKRSHIFDARNILDKKILKSSELSQFKFENLGNYSQSY